MKPHHVSFKLPTRPSLLLKNYYIWRTNLKSEIQNLKEYTASCLIKVLAVVFYKFKLSIRQTMNSGKNVVSLDKIQLMGH